MAAPHARSQRPQDGGWAAVAEAGKQAVEPVAGGQGVGRQADRQAGRRADDNGGSTRTEEAADEQKASQA